MAEELRAPARSTWLATTLAAVRRSGAGYLGYLVGLAVSVAAAVVVVRTQINLQSGRVLDAEGHGWPLGALFGPAGLLNGLTREGWTVLAGPGARAQRAADLVRFGHDYLVSGWLFIPVYLALLGLLLHAVTTPSRWRTVGNAALAVAALADAVENVLAWRLLGSSSSAITPVIVATAVKCTGFAIFAIVVLLRLLIPLPARVTSDLMLDRATLRRGWAAVLHHRFSFVPVVPLFVLTVLSGTAILEQLPDVQRRWISDGVRGFRHAVFAITAIGVVAVLVFLLGRFRTGYARRRANLGEDELYAPGGSALLRRWDEALGGRPNQRLLRSAVAALDNLVLWLVALGVLAVLTALCLVEAPTLILWRRLAVFAAVPAAIVVGSLLVRRYLQRHQGSEPVLSSLRFPADQLPTIAFVGNVAAASVVVVGGLSLLRSLTPLVVVRSAVTGAPAAPVWVLLIVGALAVTLPWLGLCAAVRFRHRRTLRADVRSAASGLDRLAGLGQGAPRSLTGRVVWLLGTVVVFWLLAAFPRTSEVLGVSATATLAIGALTGMVGTAGLIVQDRPTAAIFRLFRFRRTPLVSIAVLALVLVGLFGGARSIQGIDPGPSWTPTSPRPTLGQAFATWLGNDRCDVVVDHRRVRPMLLVAAEGGGIRAAYWTVKGLQAIDQGTACGAQSTLFSAGASGGSVGLTVARFSGTAAAPGTDAAVDAVRRMAEPATLSEAAEGAFARDLAYGATGLPVPRLDSSQPWQWTDRARLIEQGWTRASLPSSAWGGRSFLNSGTDQSPSPGQLILNSTSVRNGCRVWVSQVQVSPTTPIAVSGRAVYDPERSCDTTPSYGPRTIDLFAAYGPYGASGPGCIGNLRAATAALLTARFPYVTPSGVVGPCPTVTAKEGASTPYWPEAQLVDGGYIENAGLATITDLSSQWLSLVRAQNSRAVTDPSQVLVVPLVVFLSNGDRKVTHAVANQAPSSEFAVPLVTLTKDQGSLDTSEAMLQRARAVTDLRQWCPTGTGGPQAAAVCAGLDDWFPSRVVIVDRITQSEVAPPLGWTLSPASMSALDSDMAAAETRTCRANVPKVTNPSPVVSDPDASEPSCRDGYATLGDLVRYYTYRP